MNKNSVCHEFCSVFLPSPSWGNLQQNDFTCSGIVKLPQGRSYKQSIGLLFEYSISIHTCSPACAYLKTNAYCQLKGFLFASVSYFLTLGRQLKDLILLLNYYGHSHGTKTLWLQPWYQKHFGRIHLIRLEASSFFCDTERQNDIFIWIQGHDLTFIHNSEICRRHGIIASMMIGIINIQQHYFSK